MQLRPRLDESPLDTRQLPGNEVNRLNAENPDVFLMVGMEVRRVVTDSSLHEHSDDDAEEPADLGHGMVILRPAPALRF